MFYSSILNKLSVIVQLPTQIQTHSSCFVKNQAWIWQIPHIGYFCVNSWKFTQAQAYFTQMPLVILVTNSMCGMYFSSWTENFCCSEKDRCAILANLTNAPIHLLAKNVRTVPLQFKLRIFRGVNYFIQLTELSRQESLSGGVWCADNSKSFISRWRRLKRDESGERRV